VLCKHTSNYNPTISIHLLCRHIYIHSACFDRHRIALDLAASQTRTKNQNSGSPCSASFLCCRVTSSFVAIGATHSYMKDGAYVLVCYFLSSFNYSHYRKTDPKSRAVSTNSVQARPNCIVLPRKCSIN
jgi:hypothetical protein